MPFGLQLTLKYPRNVFLLEPPVPFGEVGAPRAETDFGQILFYFDSYDFPAANSFGDPPLPAGSFTVDFRASSAPAGALEFASRLIEMPALEEHLRDRFGTEVERVRGTLGLRGEEGVSVGTESEGVKERDDELLGWYDREAANMFDVFFADPLCGGYLNKLGKCLRGAILNFQLILRTRFNQYLVPDSLPIMFGGNGWTLPDGSYQHASNVFLSRLLGLRTWADPIGINLPVRAAQWEDVTILLRHTYEPPFVEILLASARAQCDPDMGNARLGLVEAVVALEIEVKRVIAITLSELRVPKNAVDRIVRETPLADLAAVWVRRALPQASEDDPIFQLCANAVHERNECIHHQRRRIAPERVLSHIGAISKLVSKLRMAYPTEESGERRPASDGVEGGGQ